MGYYQLNKEYIARVLCENRDKPQLHCDGKCYLAKRLKAQQDKQDKETSERIQQLPILQLFCDIPLHFTFEQPFLAAAHQSFAYLMATYTAPLHGLLRPPTA